jgi:hypothetical protein
MLMYYKIAQIRSISRRAFQGLSRQNCNSHNVTFDGFLSGLLCSTKMPLYVFALHGAIFDTEREIKNFYKWIKLLPECVNTGCF